jgi:hypothetical protein
MLRAEVHSVDLLKDEINALKGEIKSLRTGGLQGHLSMENQPADATKDASMYSKVVASNTAPWIVVSKPPCNEAVTKPSAQCKKPRQRQMAGICGCCKDNLKVKSVATKRSIDIFVYRLDPCTNTEEVVGCVQDILGDSGILPPDIVCEKFVSMHTDLYASFHVSIRVELTTFKQCLDRVSTADMWPYGVFVKRYFVPEK